MINTERTRHLDRKSFTPPVGVDFKIMNDFLKNPALSMADLARKYNVSLWKAIKQTNKMLAMSRAEREQVFGYKEKN